MPLRHASRKAGQTALDYLIRWRVHRTAHLLQRSDMSLTEIAAWIGYESDAAFNRMFKQEIGATPGRFRRGREDGSDATG